MNFGRVRCLGNSSKAIQIRWCSQQHVVENRAVLYSLQHVANTLHHGNIATYAEQHFTTTCGSNKCCLVYDALKAFIINIWSKKVIFRLFTGNIVQRQIFELHNFRRLSFYKISLKQYSRIKDSVGINTVFENFAELNCVVRCQSAKHTKENLALIR